MPMNDGYDPDHALPSFLSRADEHEQLASEHEQLASEHEQWATSEYEELGAYEHELLSTSGIPKASILVIAVLVGGVAIALSLGNPVKLFAAMASLPDNSAIQRGADQSTPAIQSIADAQTSMPAPAPVRDQIAAAAPADQAQTETNEPPPGTLLRQFQAWAAKEEAQVQEQAEAQEEYVTPPRPVQAAPFQIEADDPAPEQPTHRHRRAKSVQSESVQNARAEVRHVQKPKARVQREQNAPGQAAPVQDARAQEQPAQSAQAPSFLQSIGLHQ